MAAREIAFLPRRRQGHPAATLALGAAFVVAIGPAAVRTQTAPSSTLLRPAWDGDPNAPPGFRTEVSRGALTTGRFRLQRLGTPPASGAGTTGFDSSNNLLAKNKANKTAAPRKPKVAAVAQSPTLPGANATRRRDPLARPGASATPPDLTATVRPRRTPVEEDPFAPLGIRVGAFTFRPAVELTGAYDTNPARAANGSGSMYVIVAPELKVKSDWLRHELAADIHGTYSAYKEEFVPSLDRPSLDGKITGRLDATSRTRIDLEGRLLLGTENPGSPNLQAGLAKLPIFTTLGVTGGVVQRFNRFEIGAKGSVDRTTYQDSVLIDGTSASNDDRDYNQYRTELRGGYELTPGVKPFAAIELDRRVHDLPEDRLGIQRDSSGVTPKLGTTFELTRKLTGEASIGYLTRTYKDPSLSELRGLVSDVSLVWTASALTTAKLSIKSTADESTQAGISGILKRDIGVQLDHSFRRWLIGTLKVGFGVDDYVGSGREDHRYTVSAGITYKMSRTVQVKGEFRNEWLRSSETGADYTASAVLVGLRLQR